MSKGNAVEEIGARIHLLVIALIILAVVLTAYMFVECTLLLYSLYKKKMVHSDPDSVVVKSSKKGSKKSKKSRRKSSKSSKSSNKKRSSKSKSKSKKTPSGKRRRSSKASAPLPSQAKKQVVKSAEKPVESAKSKKTSTPAAKSAIPPSNLQIPKTFEGIHPDEFSAGTSTDKLNARISPQFDTPKTASDVFSAGTATEQINANVPPQFGIPALPPFDTPNPPSTILHPTPEFVREVAEQVVGYLEARNTVASGLSQNKYASLETPKLPRRDVRKMPIMASTITPTATPPQQSTPLSDNRSLEQQLASPSTATAKEPTDSVFMMDVGSNGEINKVHAPSPKGNAINSLMLDTQNVVPVDGRPNEGQKQEGQKPEAQPGTVKGSGTQL